MNQDASLHVGRPQTYPEADWLILQPKAGIRDILQRYWLKGSSILHQVAIHTRAN